MTIELALDLDSVLSAYEFMVLGISSLVSSLEKIKPEGPSISRGEELVGCSQCLEPQCTNNNLQCLCLYFENLYTLVDIIVH